MEKRMDFKKNWSLRIAGILFYLVVVSTWMLSGLFAKYTSSDTGMDESRTAIFYVQETGTMKQSFAIDMLPGDHFTKDIKIVNNSETEIVYEIMVQTEGNLPLVISSGSITNLEKSDQKISGSLDALNNAEQLHEINVLWAEDEKSYMYSDEIDRLTFVLKCNQVD